MQSRLAIVETYLAAFASGVPDNVANCVTDDFVNEHLSELGSGCVGRSSYRDRLPGFLTTFAGVRYSVERIGQIGDDGPDGDVVAHYVLHSEFEGTLIEIPGMMWFEVRSGLIARRTDVWDSLTFLRQTGQST